MQLVYRYREAGAKAALKANKVGLYKFNPNPVYP
jgi:hypothetical protein